LCRNTNVDLRVFKLEAPARMETAETVTGLAQELGIRRELLHKWRRAHDAGGAPALQPIGRPLNASKSDGVRSTAK
jgi:transposase-like protein